MLVARDRMPGAGSRERGPPEPVGLTDARTRSRYLTSGRSLVRMDRGLYIAASGMLAEQIRQDQIANDLANASTPGYKGDRTAQRSFGDLLLASSATGATVGRQSTAVQVDAIETDFSPQPARETGEALDFAITGEGFFSVQTDQGVRYTRNGQFSLDPQGRLVTAQGDPVLDAAGRTITAHRRQGRSAPDRRGRAHEPAQGRRLARHRHPRRRRRGHRPRRRARGLRRRRRPLDGRHDRLHARLRGGPEGHPGDRRHARPGRGQDRRVEAADAEAPAQVLGGQFAPNDPEGDALGSQHRGCRHGGPAAAHGRRRQRPGEREHDRLQAPARRVPRPRVRPDRPLVRRGRAHRLRRRRRRRRPRLRAGRPPAHRPAARRRASRARASCASASPTAATR